MDSPKPKYKQLLESKPIKRIKSEVYNFCTENNSEVLNNLVEPWMEYVEEIIKKIDPDYIPSYLVTNRRVKLNCLLEHCFLKAVEDSEDKGKNNFLECLKERILELVNEFRPENYKILDFEFH